jgi:hypothetical protein
VTGATFIPPDNRHVHIVGRTDPANAAGIRFGWPGVYIYGAFNGTSCRIIFEHVHDDSYENEDKHHYRVSVDTAPARICTAETVIDTYTVCDGLDAGHHTFSFYRITESSRSYAVFKGLLLDDNASMQQVDTVSQRKIEYLGDSHTAGYCAGDPAGTQCWHSEYNSYASLVARHFNAAHHNISVSGKALLLTPPYSQQVDVTMPEYYPRALAHSESPQWDLTAWNPHITMIDIGVNDYSGYWGNYETPDNREFKQTYHALLDTMRSVHPGTRFILIGPYDSCGARDSARIMTRHVYNEQIAAGHEDVFYCAYPPYDGLNDLNCHPSGPIHRRLADSLIALIQDTVGWQRDTSSVILARGEMSRSTSPASIRALFTGHNTLRIHSETAFAKLTVCAPDGRMLMQKSLPAPRKHARLTTPITARGIYILTLHQANGSRRSCTIFR